MDLVSETAPPVGPEPPEFAGSEEFIGPRIGACVIDMVLLLTLFVVLSVTVGHASVGGGEFSFSLGWAATVLYLGLVLLYYFVFEATIGRTVGKLLVGLRVTGRNYGRPPVWAVVTRTLLRLVDWLPLLYLVGFVSMLATGARRQRLGDLAAGTRVPRATPIPHRGLASVGVAVSVLIVAAGSVLYVAVFGGRDLDTAKVEDFMIDHWPVPGTPLDSVHCPRRVKQRKGNSFQCVGRVADQDVTFRVTQENSGGSVQFDSVEVFLNPEKIADTISQQLSEKIGQPVHVECGRSRFLAKKVGSTFTCDASTGSGETATVTVTVKDRQGSFDWRLE